MSCHLEQHECMVAMGEAIFKCRFFKADFLKTFIP